ncbi:hypothetical protein GGI19_001715 [Coemansia pectinata]|uniref:Uncharacterized protein n=1 Tax=Coemansia pectinata TaxID=1052879 RepID=A0A9W8LD86_9FUNG|nr:hypothetical protein GGI19_001715 [Coemansia pectinata]
MLTVFTPTFGTHTFYLPVTSNVESDTPFLQYMPSQSVAYGIGGLFIALFLASLATAGLARSPMYLGAVVSSLCLSISLFLRGSLVGGTSMYIASFVLDSVAAYLLLVTALLMCGRWIAYVEDGRTPFPTLLACTGLLVFVGCVVLEAVALPLTFYGEAWYRHIGHILHVASVSATLAGAGIGFLVTVWKAVVNEGRCLLVEVGCLAMAFVLLLVWSSYALAQAKLPLGQTGGEVAWYLLNVLPLGLVLVTWTVLNAPRVFNYEVVVVGKPPVYRLRHSRSYGGHYEYPAEYSYPLRAPGVPDFCRQSGSSSGVTEEKIQKAILRYA